MIYKQIEDADKVFGRSQKISTGSFTEGFQLIGMYMDEREVTSELTKYVQSGVGEADDNSDLLGLNSDDLTLGNYVTSPDYDGFDSKFLIQGYNPSVDVTDNYHEGHWTDVRFGDYYVNVFNEEPMVGELENENSELQFSISYGNKHGYGSRKGTKTASVTQAIYNQYRKLS